MILPFTAIVGQEDLKTGLIVNVIDPSIGGVLIMGEKGTAKSTAVRALAELLPEYSAIKGCAYRCHATSGLCSACQAETDKGASLSKTKVRMRVVELPLGVTEDRLVGTLDIERAIKHGEKRFEPGILAEANRNFLYVDEVNLLEDHIVDLLLDSAAMGVNTVEREGISFSHPARFILVGTMNPEEGDLRPQLLDRFGLSVQVGSIVNKAARVEVLRRKAAFDADQQAFAAEWQAEQDKLAAEIVTAQQLLPRVQVNDATLEAVVDLTMPLNLDGHRADIVILKTARALSALHGLETVGEAEIKQAARLALGHRLRRLPFEEMGASRLEAAGIAR